MCIMEDFYFQRWDTTDLKHHLEVAGVRHQLFSEEAVTAIHQGSGGLPCRANALARGALMAAAIEKAPLASADHVRKASSELIGSPMPSALTDPLQTAADLEIKIICNIPLK